VEGRGGATTAKPSIRKSPYKNHAFFLGSCAKARTDLSVVCRGISKLLVVDVALSRDQTTPADLREHELNRPGALQARSDPQTSCSWATFLKHQEQLTTATTGGPTAAIQG